MQVYRYTGIHMQVYRYTDIEVYRYAGTQVYMVTGTQVYRYTGKQVYRWRLIRSHAALHGPKTDGGERGPAAAGPPWAEPQG